MWVAWTTAWSRTNGSSGGFWRLVNVWRYIWDANDGVVICRFLHKMFTFITCLQRFPALGQWQSQIENSESGWETTFAKLRSSSSNMTSRSGMCNAQCQEFLGEKKIFYVIPKDTTFLHCIYRTNTWSESQQKMCVQTNQLSPMN